MQGFSERMENQYKNGMFLSTDIYVGKRRQIYHRPNGPFKTQIKPIYCQGKYFILFVTTRLEF